MRRNSIDLESFDVDELEALKERIDVQIEKIRKEKLERLTKIMTEEAEKMGLEIEDVINTYPGVRIEKSPVRKTTVRIKYRDEKGHEWTGRGRTPRWVLKHVGVEKLDRNSPEQMAKLKELEIK